MAEDFFFKWRLIEAWHQPDGVALHSRARNIFSWEAMRSIGSSTELGRYVEEIRNRGFNGLVLYGPRFKAQIEERPDEHKIMSRFLTSHDISLFIRRDWSECEQRSPEVNQTGWGTWPELYGQTRASNKLCPYANETRTYWADRIGRDYQIIPDLAGYRLEGSEFDPFGGAPWMCNCQQCNALTPRERTRDAVCLVARLLEPFGGTVIWMNCEDDPGGQRQETDHLRDMTGEIPGNAFIVTKQKYWDFHSRWPRHPLYDTIAKDTEGKSPYMSALQQPGEYHGCHEFPWCNVDEWSKAFRDMYEAGMQGVMVVAQVHHDGWDHPLNMVNWSALTEYMHNPNADPQQLKLSWARKEFGFEVASTVVEVLNNVTESARGAFEFDALWTACHSRLANLAYMDSHLCGPLRQTSRMKRMIGIALPLDMYKAERAAEIKKDPNVRLVFNRVEITLEVKAQAIKQKQDGVTLMQNAVNLWCGLGGKIDAEIHKKILEGLRGNRDDTMIFLKAMDLYMDWKLGLLTEEKIDATLHSCKGLRGVIVSEPLTPRPKEATPGINPVSLKTFSEELRRELREPWIESYWQEHPLGVF